MQNKTMTTALILALLMATGAAQAGGDAARGAELAIDCADCHGEDGQGDSDVPAIAGLDPAKHVDLLKKYKSGELSDEDGMMQLYTEALSEQDMKDLAAYYATLD
ncbi:MAG: c-type cytochrome [Xanthomonadales bacterium]|nr:c-type cytochrome [Xanthomonadales bacterium]